MDKKKAYAVLQDWVEGETPWESTVCVNGNKAKLIIDRNLGSICEWVPFDSFRDGAHVEIGYALVNCNSASPLYGAVATMIGDDHGRFAFNVALHWFSKAPPGEPDFLTLQRYLEKQAKDASKTTKADEKDRPHLIERIRSKLKQVFYYG